jgi:hypothetical protein
LVEKERLLAAKQRQWRARAAEIINYFKTAITKKSQEIQLYTFLQVFNHMHRQGPQFGLTGIEHWPKTALHNRLVGSS